VAWSPVTLTSTTVISLTQIACPQTTIVKCLIIGNGTSGGKTGALVLYGATTGPLSAEFPLDTGATVTSLTQLLCPSAVTCIAIGTNTVGSTTSPEIFTATVTPSVVATLPLADLWSKDAVTTSGGTITTPTQVACATATACLVMAAGTSTSGPPQGFLLQTADASSWSNVGLPSSDNVLYFDDIDCTSGTSATCSAVGATSTGTAIVTSTNGPGGSWADQTPSGLSGLATTGIPVETNNSGLSPTNSVNVVTAGASANVTQLPALYPFPGGYPLWAGDCVAEQNGYNTSQATTIPGGVSGSTASMATPTIPLGLVSVQVAHKTGTSQGLPYAGVGLTLTVAANANGCGQDTYTLQTTGVDGLSRTEVPYGTYTLSTVIGATTTAYGTITVAGSTTTLTTTGGTPVTTTVALPSPVTVSS
jgi:hypothetical protein